MDDITIKEICGNADRGQFGNARVLVKKQLKKYPSNTDVQLSEAYIDFKQGLRTRALEKAMKIDQFNSINTISILQTIYTGLGEFDKLSNMFETAFKSASNRPQLAFEVLELWFMSMLESGHLRGLLQVCITRQKLVGNRLNILKTVFAYYLVCKYNSESLSISEKSLFPMLAARLMDKFEPLETAQDLYLKGLVMSIQKDLAISMKYLFDPSIMTKCPLLEMEMLRLEIADKINDNETLFSHCRDYLKNQIDNWVHWKLLVKSGISLGKQDQLRTFISEYPVSRNSKLAAIELDHDDQSFKSYFDKYGTKRCAYEDLRSYDLDEDWLNNYQLQKLDSMDHLINNVNLVKFQPEKYSVSRLVTMYSDSLHLTKNKDPSDYHPGDDYILLAMAKLLKEATDSITILKCIVLLEKAIEHDQHQFHIRLWLCTLYQLLGAHSLALGHYRSLNIKNVQCESMSHFILGRFGSLYPKEESPLQEPEIVYGEADDLGQVLKMTLDREVYSKAYGIMDMNHRLKNSFSQRLLDLEKLRVVRYSANNLGNSVDLDIEKPIDKLVDNRDFDIIQQPFPNMYKETYNKLPRPNKIGRDWLEMEMLRESLLRYGILDVNSELTAELLASKAQITKEKLQTSSETTKAEKWSIEVHLSLVDILHNVDSSEKYQETEKLFIQSPTLIADLTQWESIHSAFTILHTAKIVIAFCHRLKGSKQGNINIKGIGNLTNSVNKAVDKVKLKALETKNLRNKLAKDQAESIRSWINQENLKLDLNVQSVIDGLGQSLDTTLTLLRSVKM